MKSIILLFLIFLPIWAFSQTQTIKGRVIDRDTQQPLIGATVIVLNSNPVIGATTDETGVYQLERVPIGRASVRCTYIGYSSFVSDNLILNTVKELVLDISMMESISTTDAVEIVAGDEDVSHSSINKLSVVSTRSFSVEETQRYAGSVNDPSRMAMGFPGVQASQDNNSDMIIRGNSPSGLLWRLEGVDIPNPNHFARKGSSGGGITVFSAQLLGNSDFSTGAFASEYGNAFSGVFDMRFRKGNLDNREFRFKFGLLGIDLAAEGPIKKGRSSYLVNYRYSTLGILNDVGFRLVGARIDNNFQDLSFNLYFPMKNDKSFLTIFGVGGLSEELWDPVSDSLVWSQDYRTTTDFLTDMGAVGATFTHLIDEKSYLKAVVAVSGNRIVDNDDTLNVTGLAPNLLPNEIDPKTLTESPFKTEDYRNSRVSSHVFYNRKFSPQLTLKTGVMATYMNFGFEHELFNPKQNEFETLVSGEGNTTLLQGYAQFRFRPTEKLTLNAGFHSMFLALNQTSSIEPRLSLKYQLPGNQSLSLGYGLHSQVLPLGSYFTKVGTALPNQNLDLVKAHHIIAAYEKVFKGNLRFRLEGYYQSLYNVPVSPSDTSSYWILNERDGYAEEALVSEGTGVNMGIDMTFEKFFSSGLFFLLSGSLYESNYQTLIPDKTFDTRFNGRFNTSAMGGIEIDTKKGNTWQFGSRLVYNGGLRYTPGDPELSAAANELVTRAEDAYTELAGSYFRIDLRAAYRFNRPKTAYIISLDVQNVTNNLNVRDQVYDQGADRLRFRYQSGLIPVISFQVDF